MWIQLHIVKFLHAFHCYTNQHTCLIQLPSCRNSQMHRNEQWTFSILHSFVASSCYLFQYGNNTFLSFNVRILHYSKTGVQDVGKICEFHTYAFIRSYISRCFLNLLVQKVHIHLRVKFPFLLRNEISLS